MIFKSIIAATCACLAVVSFNANAAIISTSVSASMQILDKNTVPGFVDVQDRMTDAVAASVDLTAAGSLHVQSSMVFRNLTAESAVFDFLIGMHGNGYTGIATMGAYGSMFDNSGIIHYYADAPMTATAVYDYTISNPGTDPYGNPVTFGMGAISVSNPSRSYYVLDDGPGPYPIAGHYHSEETFNLIAGDNYFSVSFQPNVSGPVSWIDGQYAGTVALNFAPVPVPAAFWLLGSGLIGLVGFAQRRK